MRAEVLITLAIVAVAILVAADLAIMFGNF